jgi:outer membrane immunogenic protein
MKKIFCCLAVSSLFGVSMYAQGTPKVDFFAGYSYLRSNPSQADYIPAGNLNGGIGSFAYNLNSHLAAEFEFGFYHNNGDVDNTSVSYLFGPRFSAGRSGKFDPFIHVLFGGMHSDLSVPSTSSLIPPIPAHPLPAPSNGRYSASQANFAMAAGGGLDFHLTKGLYFRAVQFDYMLTRFESPAFLTPAGPTSNRNQNNFRLATGIGFNFGGE